LRGESANDHCTRLDDPLLVLDSGAVSKLSARTDVARSTIRALKRQGEWPPTVPSVVLVESLQGDGRRDAGTNQFLKSCDVEEEVPVKLARRAAALRRLAGQGSAVDAILVARAEPGGVVLTGDVGDLRALAAHAEAVTVERI